MMSERQRKFREQYKADISPLYNGLLHIGVIFAAGIAALYYCATKLENATWEWLLVLPVFLAGNLVEWFMHKYVMHRRIDVFALRAIYERHTRQHHQYFTDIEPTIDTTREFRIVFFPWRVLITLGVGGGVLGYLAYLLINANAAYIVFMTMVGHYLVYEVFHYCCHVHDNWFVRNMPFINTIRRHHTAHHNQGIMMHYNMNLTFPIADWLMGTSDLRRGLLGHLFNGYSEDHIKEELKPIIRKFRHDDSRVTLDGPQLTEDERRAMAA
ncbi:sterol desaturase family protein [Cupriavidus cauae]|jgi:Fatty acid hydroxylase superfamily.|uniref:Sterol desaturase family protein n=1 Tax=Cupriavidus cauae TaxID=2608999 RepID=A0A5M8B4A2_9BURK|nr:MULTISPECIES: sterol desaturase family protein [Cupriavidus]KAA0182978.1 sterol desaturase family protein [Cupriavidus gilardii]KAA6129241.1 sterol desaturase family protein [Cupriavidus cauae]MCA7083020.1 sterol desaturase family protein [Cupriavidus sp. DB3]UZN51025.1 sterol desaturase family protein [Cupriavidus cauae]